ncbi:hypothetical protein JCM8097_000874 [Rhodosporidiobolus ruineniae]
MRPSNHSHPLSPPLASSLLDHSSSSPLFPDSRPSPRSPRAAQATLADSPLFPASSPQEGAAVATVLSRRGSAATLLGVRGGAEGQGIGLELPGAMREGEEDSFDGACETSPRSSRRRGSRAASPARDATSQAGSGDIPVPPLLVLPSAPQLLPASSLLPPSLPPPHLAALAQSLSRDLSAAISLLAERDAELAALERLALDKGASPGEVERARVRARAEAREARGEKEEETSSGAEESEGAKGKGKGKLRRKSRRESEKERARKMGEEWRIETGEFTTGREEDTEEKGEEHAGEGEEDVPPKTEVDLDLDDLNEAISSNAFDLGLQPTSPSSLHFPTHVHHSPVSNADDDASSVRSRALSLPFPSAGPDDKSDSASIASSAPSAPPALPPSSTTPAPSAGPVTAPVAIKPARTRHASLSARLFGSMVGGRDPSSSSAAAQANGLARSPSSASLSSSPSASANLAVSPPSPAKPPIKTRHARSASIKSTRSVSSVASTGGGGYGEWLWKWGGKKGGAGSILEGKEGDTASVSEVGDEGAVEPAAEGAEPAEPASAEEVGETVESDEPTTPRSSAAATATTAATTLASPELSSDSPATPPPERPASLSHRSSSSQHLLASPCPSPSSRSPSSPTLSRTRYPAPPPPAFLTATAAGTSGLAEVRVSEEVGEGTMAGAASPNGGEARSPSGKSLALPPDEAEQHDKEEGEEGGDTLKARRPSAPALSPILPPSPPLASSTGALPVVTTELNPSKPAFVPGVPLYSVDTPSSTSSASGDAASRLAEQAHRSSAGGDSTYVGIARGSLSRALGLGPASLSSTSPAPATPSADSSVAPNLTLFPRLPSLSLSRYALFAQPALSTPVTHVSLSSASGTSSAPSGSNTASSGASSGAGAAGTGGGGTLTMELSTISGEAAPPSLALLKPSYSSASTAAGSSSSAAAGAGEGDAAKDEEDGPMIDRYGFIYDVRQGMELLKESRRKEGEKAKGKGKKGAGRKKSKEKLDETLVLAPTPPSVPTADLLTPPTELEVHPQLEALREAIGLTPTTEEDKALPPPASPALTGDSSAPDSPAPPPPSTVAPSVTAKLVRAPSSPPPPSHRSLDPLPHTTTASPAPSVRSSSTSASATGSTGPQSMRALLNQLKSMTDAQEKTQREAWDAFIRRRQAKLAKLKRKEREKEKEAAASAAADGGDGKGKKRERPKTVFGEVAGEEGEEGEDVTMWTGENLVGVAQMGTEKKGRKEDWAEFKELVRKGIPIIYRPKIWGECSSANEAREPGVYQELLAQPTTDAEAPCLKQIDMDCHRTFPTNVFFAGNGPGVAKLRNVLVAYSRRNPKIGYCQGMNNLVATLLLTHPAEEDAFWVLVCIVENILPSDYYTSHLLVSRADQEVLRDLVARVLPTLAEHLEEQGVELSAITFGWFLSLFTDVLPIQTLLRVWDLFFIHGTVLLFRIALALLKLHEADLLACDSAAALYGKLGTLPAGCYHADKLLKIACEDLASSVKDREVSQLRSKHVAELQEQMGLTSTSADETE